MSDMGEQGGRRADSACPPSSSAHSSHPNAPPPHRSLWERFSVTVRRHWKLFLVAAVLTVAVFIFVMYIYPPLAEAYV